MKRIVSCLIVIGLLLTAAGCGFFTEEMTAIIYLSEELSDIETKLIATQLNEFPEITSVTYISAEEAAESFKNSFVKKDAFVSIDTDVFRDRYEITVETVNIKDLIDSIEQIQGVEEVVFFDFRK